MIYHSTHRGVQPTILGLEINTIINNTIDLETDIFTMIELIKTMQSKQNGK